MKTNTPVYMVAEGKRADIGEYKIDRLLPNRYVQAVGPFVFLDHLLPSRPSKKNTEKKSEGTGSHPHRGIATLTYILNGEAEHYDSKRHHSKVHSGGVQWMKAGNGIVHDESIQPDPFTNDLLTHSFQFWVNLPAKNKAEEAAYLPIEASDVPVHQLDNNSGWLKIIAGEYSQLQSKIPSYTKQFIYHLHLEAGTYFSLPTTAEMEYAAFLPLQSVVVNDIEYQTGDLLLFEKKEGEIEVKNVSAQPIDIILFGGETFTESIVATGPFVMTTQHEISQAYNDYYKGNYGEIKYEDVV
jgi:redox-sensitive bicupin YhaK (pirin superfamily)